MERLSILLVDDEKFLLRVLEKILESRGLLVDTANNGANAVEKIKSTHYDLIISDLMMPVMDGLRLVEWMRTDERSSVPVVILSANNDPLLADRLSHLGVKAILSKPLDIDQFADTIVRLLHENA